MKRPTYHIGLWNYAGKFYRSAEILRAKKWTWVDDPTYYLYGHAIELALKAQLAYCGYNEQELRKIGHDLEQALEKAMDNNLANYLTNINDIEQTIRMFNVYYEAKEFEYVVSGSKTYPYLKQMYEVALCLIYAVGQAIAIPRSHLNKWQIEQNCLVLDKNTDNINCTE